MNNIKYVIECNEQEYEALKISIRIAMCNCNNENYEDVKTALNTIHSFHIKTDFKPQSQSDMNYKEFICKSKYAQQHRNWLCNKGIKHRVEPTQDKEIDKILYLPIGAKEREKCEKYFERQIRENRV